MFEKQRRNNGAHEEVVFFGKNVICRGQIGLENVNFHYENIFWGHLTCSEVLSIDQHQIRYGSDWYMWRLKLHHKGVHSELCL